jgi:putative ABC transport system permease protein
MNPAHSLFKPVSALKLALAHIAQNKGGFIANALLLALAVASIIFLAVAADALNERAVRDARGVDLVVGGKGSPLQSVLGSLYHIDIPPGNIPKQDADALARHPMVALAVPVSLGDSFRGYRIVGTSAQMLDLYEARLAQGAPFMAKMQAVLGAEVAARTGLAVGGTFVGTHGLAEGGAQHAEDVYTVTGVLAPTGGVIDRLILTPLESVWYVHEGEVKDDEERKVLEAEREVTALLIRYKTPIAAATLPRAINASARMQAASPAFESARLLNLIEPALLLMKAFAALLFVAALVSIGLATVVSLRERRMDAAVLRMMGLSRPRLFGQFLLEALLLGVAGAVLGLLIAYAVLAGTQHWLAIGPKVLMPELTQLGSNGVWALIALAVALAAALIPAWRAAATEPAQMLATR